MRWRSRYRRSLWWSGSKEVKVRWGLRIFFTEEKLTHGSFTLVRRTLERWRRMVALLLEWGLKKVGMGIPALVGRQEQL